MASRIRDLNAKSIMNSTRVPAGSGKNSHRFFRCLNGPRISPTSTMFRFWSCRTQVENRSLRKEKPTAASASTRLTPGASSRGLQVRMAVTQGTNSG
jgi:hypothetical protein